jgi:hypothetical protein
MISRSSTTPDDASRRGEVAPSVVPVVTGRENIRSLSVDVVGAVVSPREVSQGRDQDQDQDSINSEELDDILDVRLDEDFTGRYLTYVNEFYR